MGKMERKRERRSDKNEKFQSFSRPKVKITKVSASGKVFVDYKDTETLRKLMTMNGKIQSRRRTSGTAQEQRMLTQAIKRARFLGLLPFVTTAM
jgi:small subunit ribosomal protein S18